MTLDPKIPAGPIEQNGTTTSFAMKLVNPANKRKIISSSSARGSPAPPPARIGWPNWGTGSRRFPIMNRPRRAHSISAQGGINAPKNYPNDGDSVYRLFYDTVKGGDYRAREANVYRLSQVSNAIIDQCVAQGVRSRGNTGDSLTTAPSAGPRYRGRFTPGGRQASSCSSAYSAMMRQVGLER